MSNLPPNGRGQQAAPPKHIPDPTGPDALTITDGQNVAGTIVESDRSHFVFGIDEAFIGEYRTRTEAMRAVPPLAKQADAILRRAHCDAVTGAKKDHQFRRNKRAEAKRLSRYRRGKAKKLGKFGPASPVRNIEPEGR